MFIRDAYQKINPKIQVTCDAWWNKELYQGIDDETYATKDIAIAIERWYDAKYAAQIIKSGRKVGIWGWYLSDFEMTYGSHLYSKTLDQYFSSLPPEASQQVDWLSLELCFHGLPSQINLYIVGRKMWDPKANLHDIMRDYCAAVYGPENAATMVKVYETVEAGQKEVRYGMVQHDRYPIVLGTPEFKAKVDQLLPELLKVELPKGWIANFPFVNDPQSDIDHLTKDLKAFAATPVTLTAQTPAPATTAKPVTQTTTAPVKEVPPRDPNNYFLKPKDVVLFLGNSITEGAQPEIDLIKADLKKHYPSLAEGPDAVTFVLGGVSGEQAAAGKVRVKALIAKHKPTVCVVCYGTCEVTFKKEDGFIPAMKEIIHELKNANVQVVIVSAPPPSARNWKQPDAWPASQFEAGIPMMVSQAFQLTCEESLLYVNANQAISSEVTKTGGEFTTDGIHLTPDGYRIMAQALQAAWSFGKPATK
jgi:lysophospholipase L1-like esterase